MFTTHRGRSLIVILMSFAVAGLPTVALANHSWGGYHWARMANPFTVKLGDNVSSAWDSYLGTASSDWSTSTLLDTTVVAGQAKSRNCRPTSGRVEVCSSTYGNNGWLGLASIWISGKHITQGSVKLNDTYFASPAYDTPGWRHLVACQEIGHTFGLDHQDTNFDNTNLGTCMDYTSNPYGPPSNEHPNKHDYDELITIYSHLDDTTTVGQPVGNSGQIPPAMNDIDLDGPGQWGKLVRQSRDGHTALYELDFGGGNKIYTFVIWADGDGDKDRDRDRDRE